MEARTVDAFGVTLFGVRRSLLFLGISVMLCLGGSVQAGPSQQLGRAYQAFESGDFAESLRLGKTIEAKRLKNPDYLAYLIAQSEYFAGDKELALAQFRKLVGLKSSSFKNLARWRVADCLWSLERRKEATKAYKDLVRSKTPGGELAIARFRLAQAVDPSDKATAIQRYQDFLRKHPGHSLSETVDTRLVALGDGGFAALSSEDRITRGIDLIAAKKWEIAITELAELDTSGMPPATLLRYKFWISMAMFKRRRHYARAGQTFLSIYKKMGDRADEALFHGARALSRADFDSKAIDWYQTLVKEYPGSKWTPEAQFLSGWLEFNRGDFQKALPYLRVMKRYRKSRFADEAIWYLGMSHFLLGEYKAAIPFFEKVAAKGGKEIGGKGVYWKARALHKLGKLAEANRAYRGLVGDYPFSWYALLSQSRLREQGKVIGPFGDSPRDPEAAPQLAATLSKKIARDELILRSSELIGAGLKAEAGKELRRGESSFLKRHKSKRGEAMSVLLDAYRRAENFNRPWMLSIVHGGRRALNAEPTGRARRWWEHAYPLAYRELVEKYRELSGFPDYYLYTIMRKESGFNPHTHSYADAQGLLQMIPPTTMRVVPHLGIEYTEDLLFDPERNIEAGAWYIGRLLKKFRGQVPIGAGSFNSGPRAVMRWLRRNGDRPIDEYVELASYRQTRKYMKRTTETYARYKYLYDKAIYQQPLIINADFVINDIDY